MPREKMAGGNLREDVAEVALEQWTERSKERRQRFRNLVRRMKTVWNGCRMSGLRVGFNVSPTLQGDSIGRFPY